MRPIICAVIAYGIFMPLCFVSAWFLIGVIVFGLASLTGHDPGDSGDDSI